MNPWPSLFEHAPSWSVVGTAVALAIVVAWGAAQLVSLLLRRAMPRLSAAARPGSHPAAQRLLRAIRLALFLVLIFVFLPPILELVGEPIRAGLKLRTIGSWAVASGVRVLFVLVLAGVLARIVAISTGRFQQAFIESHHPPSPEHQKRANTLGGLVQNVARAFIFAAAAVMILDELQIDTQPILAGAGIVGLGLGFGAQTLVKDVISGFFLIVDNLVRVGDTAEINGTGGLVEAINLRTIVLRDVRGAVHVFPCGSVNTLTNLTKDYAYAVLDVLVSYRSNTDEVALAMREAGAALREDPVFEPMILEPMEVLGIERFGDTGMTVRARMKTLPAQQWNVTRALRRLVKAGFDKRGIQMTVAGPPSAPPAATDLR
ncbi:MAG TPA: mechanosensitive ion channel family protein [Vicinamibacterales bacterium]|nr:mechanosensitive ion channel family protein [Vicinamibacterales bacterium]